jgi:uncharacterized membrane protein
VVHFRSDLLVCGVTNGCHTVQNSTYATLVGIPIAILGIAMYVLLFGLGALRLRHPEHRESASYVAFAIALTGLLYAS